MEIAVVIPFFQRDRGLLERAINSVLAQQDVRPAIFVVDDGSPVRAADELANIRGANLRLVEQPNTGPGAARNRALDCLPQGIEAVAFLDSDDTWEPGHLRNATAAFAQGADLYFADWQPLGETATWFPRLRTRPNGIPLPRGDCLVRYRGDLIEAILRSSPLGTSTIVYRRNIAPNLRFREDLFAGEDLLFWMGLAKAAGWIAYSTRCEAIYGRGVNIAAGATWRDERVLRHLMHAARMHRLLPRIHDLTETQGRLNKQRRIDLQRSYARNLLAMLWHRQAIEWSELARFVHEEPRLLLSIGRAAIWGATGR